jgi:hypothetical protein
MAITHEPLYLLQTIIDIGYKFYLSRCFLWRSLNIALMRNEFIL